jgi:D-alanine-D-alanine ligase
VSRRRTKVAVLYNEPTLPPDHPDSASEADVVAVARTVSDALTRKGLDAWPVPAAAPIGKLLGKLANPAPDVVFNLIEGFAGQSLGEARVTGLLELLGLGYTGCSPEAQGLCHSKAKTKALLKGLGLPTARFALVRSGEPVPRWDGPWPVLLKPEAEDASLGIDQASVVRTAEAIVEGVARLRVRYGRDVLIESYLPGREFNVGVLALFEPKALPIAEILYQTPAGAWPILTYAAKWDVGSAEDRNTRPQCPAEIEPALAENLAELAVEAFRATGCRDYARVDFRLDADGLPMILEVNPNPDIGPEAGWARALLASGLDYDATLAALVVQADRRRHDHDHARR